MTSWDGVDAKLLSVKEVRWCRNQQAKDSTGVVLPAPPLFARLLAGQFKRKAAIGQRKGEGGGGQGRVKLVGLNRINGSGQRGQSNAKKSKGASGR